MKVPTKCFRYLAGILLLLPFFFSYGQSVPGCENINFENGTLDGWESGNGCQPGGINQPTWAECNDPNNTEYRTCCRINAGAQLNVPSVENTNIISYDWAATLPTHTIYTQPGIDLLTGLNVLPPPYPGLPDVNASLRLGNADNGSQADMIERTITITEANAIFVYQFVFVLNDPRFNHTDAQLPYLAVTVWDEDGDEVDCMSFRILANDQAFTRDPSPTILMTTGPQIAGNLSPFGDNAGDISYIDWTPVFGNFTPYVGQTMRMRIEVGDCGRSGHFGYAYIANRCLPYEPLEDTTICSGDSVMLVSPFPETGYDILWSTGETDDTIWVAPTTTQTYSLDIITRTVFSSLDPCTEQYQVTVNVDQGGIPNIPDERACVGGSATLSAIPADSVYDWFLNPADVSPFQNGNSLFVSPVNNDTTFWVSGNGCGSGLKYPVNIIVEEANADAGPDQHICSGGGTPLNATGGVTYSWSPTTGLDNPNISNPNATPNVTTTYVVTVRNDIGCEDRDTVTVFIDEIVASVSPDDTICPGESTQLQAGGGTIFFWSPDRGLNDNTISNPIASPDRTTTYVVGVSDESGCVDTNMVTVYVGGVTVDVEDGGTICKGNSFQLQADGGLFYLWSPTATLNNPIIANPVATPDETTIYTVTITGPLGCQDSADVEVIVEPLIGTISPDDTICIGESTTLQAGGGQIYLWEPNDGTISDINSPNPTVTPTNHTTYTVYMSDTTGNCRDTLEVTVSVDEVFPDAGIGASICPGASTGLLAGGGGTYLWSPAGTLDFPDVPNPIANPQVQTTYTVQVTSEWGFCVGEDTVTVTIETLVANISPDDTVCAGEFVQLQATGGTIYSWTPLDGTLSEYNTANPLATPFSTTTYSVHVQDDAGCEDSAQVTIYVESMTPGISANDTICLDQNVTIQATGGDIYLWTPSDAFTDPTQATQTFTPSSTATYSVNITNSSGVCEEDLDVTIVVDNISVNLDDIFLCLGNTHTLDPVVNSVSTVGPGITYQWTPGTNLSATNIENPVVTANSSENYTLTVTNESGCTDSDNMMLTAGIVDVEVDDVDPLCQGDTVRLHASGAQTYVWTPDRYLYYFGADSMANPLSQPFSSITYTVTGYDASGQCEDSDTVRVEVRLATAEAGPDQVICSGGSATLQALGNGSFSWSPATLFDDPTSPTPTVTPTVNPTIVYLEVNDNGCIATDSLTISLSSNTVNGIADPPLILQGEITTLSAEPVVDGDSIIWIVKDTDFIIPGPYGDDGSVVTLPDSSTNYQVISISALGCIDTADTHVILLPPIKIPNVFTPNGDDINDNWVVTNLEHYVRAEVIIYNRWGSVVWKKKGIYGNDFKGSNSRGDLLPVGTYYFVIDLGWRGLQYGGDVTIMR